MVLIRTISRQSLQEPRGRFQLGTNQDEAVAAEVPIPSLMKSKPNNKGDLLLLSPSIRAPRHPAGSLDGGRVHVQGLAFLRRCEQTGALVPTCPANTQSLLASDQQSVRTAVFLFAWPVGTSKQPQTQRSTSLVPEPLSERFR